MRYRVRIFLGDQILFGHVGDIGTLGIFSQQVVIRLLFARPVLDRDRLPPFFGICELRVDVENDAAEGMHAVLNDLPDLEFCGSNVHCVTGRLVAKLFVIYRSK